METYLEKLLSQIRCTKARPYIEEEIRNHMECQIEDNITKGMSYEEAERNAVKDMGDPVEVGVALDRIHKPRIAWKLMIIVGILSLLGIGVQISILTQKDYFRLEPYMQVSLKLYTEAFVQYVIIGFVIMCGILLIDYTMIAKYAKAIGFFIIAMGVIVLTGFFGADINGVRKTIGFGALRISAQAFMTLMVPIYGAILYQYRGGGFGKLLKALLWLVVPIWITFRIPNIVSAYIMLMSMLVQLTVAIRKGWFRLPIKKTIAFLWTACILFPFTSLLVMYTFGWLKTYQTERIHSFFTAYGDGNYLTSMLRKFGKNIALFGKSGNEVIGTLPEISRDYVFTYILNSYGLFAGMLVVAVLSILFLYVFSSVRRQKNELGMVMGFGCGMILVLNTVINLLQTMGMIPIASSFLPFLSIGRDNVCLCYALMGIVMSIYRYKDVFPAQGPLSSGNASHGATRAART